MILVERDRAASADSEPPIEPLVVSVKNAAIILDAGRSTVWEMLASGELDAVKDGGRTKVTMASIKRRLANLPRAKFKPAAPRKRRSRGAATPGGCADAPS
jgi:excisionase family DNA binding protein